jgi:hypothetical protein
MHENLCELAPPSRLNASDGRVSVRCISPEALAEALIDSWQRPSERALEPNADLTPMFFLPALLTWGHPCQSLFCSSRRAVVN